MFYYNYFQSITFLLFRSWNNNKDKTANLTLAVADDGYRSLECGLIFYNVLVAMVVMVVFFKDDFYPVSVSRLLHNYGITQVPRPAAPIINKLGLDFFLQPQSCQVIHLSLSLCVLYFELNLNLLVQKSRYFSKYEEMTKQAQRRGVVFQLYFCSTQFNIKDIQYCLLTSSSHSLFSKYSNECREL